MSRAPSLSRTLITLHRAGVFPRVTQKPDGSVVFDLTPAQDAPPIDAIEAEALEIDRVIHGAFSQKLQKPKHI